MISNLYRVYCRSCNHEGAADIVCRHLDGKPKMRCQYCCSVDVKIVELDAHNGQRLGRIRILNKHFQKNYQ